MNGKISHVTGFKELISNKMPILSKDIFRFNTIPIKTSLVSFTEEKKKSNNLYRTQRAQIEKAILTKKNKAGGIMFPDFKLY